MTAREYVNDGFARLWHGEKVYCTIFAAMPSLRFIGKMLVALLVTVSAMGHVHNAALAAHFPTAKGDSHQYHKDGGDLSASAVLALQSVPSKDDGTTVKRHKRLLITKVFEAVVAFTIIKPIRPATPVPAYTSPHLLQRPAVAFSLRGPPVSMDAIV
jgi:hypothetical protein